VRRGVILREFQRPKDLAPTIHGFHRAPGHGGLVSTPSSRGGKETPVDHADLTNAFGPVARIQHPVLHGKNPFEHREGHVDGVVPTERFARIRSGQDFSHCQLGVVVFEIERFASADSHTAEP
jgi:hypothetical protein